MLMSPPPPLYPSLTITCSHSNRWLHRASITTHARPAQGSPCCCCLCQRSVVVDALIYSHALSIMFSSPPPHLPSASSLFLLLLLFLGLLRARAFAFGLSFCSFCFILFALVINVMNLLHAPPRPLPASRPPPPPSPSPISCCCPAHLLYYLGSSFYCNDMKHTRHARFKCSALLLIPCNWHLASRVVAYKIYIAHKIFKLF